MLLNKKGLLENFFEFIGNLKYNIVNIFINFIRFNIYNVKLNNFNYFYTEYHR